MRISKPYFTFLTNMTLAIVGSIIASLTNSILLIPLFFGIGIPLVNIKLPLTQKLGLIFVTVVVSTAIFIVTIFALIGFDFDKYFFPGLLVGLAGVAILGINGLLIETIRLNFKSVFVTFLLSGVSLPVWVLLTENILPVTISENDLVRHFGVMLFWMTLTTLGVCLSIKPEKVRVVE